MMDNIVEPVNESKVMFDQHSLLPQVKYLILITLMLTWSLLLVTQLCLVTDLWLHDYHTILVIHSLRGFFSSY